MDPIRKRTALIAFGDAFAAAARAWIATPRKYRTAGHLRSGMLAFLKARDCFARAGLGDLAERHRQSAEVMAELAARRRRGE